MKKKKVVTLKNLDRYDQNVYRMNEAFQNVRSPVSNIQNFMITSALDEQVRFTHDTAEQLKSLNTFDQLQSAAVAQTYVQSIKPISDQIQSAAAATVRSYAQSIEPISVQFQSVAAVAAQSYAEAFVPLNDQLSDMMKQLKLNASTTLVQMAESLQRFNELYPLGLSASFSELSKNLNQSWTDAWNQNFGAISSSVLDNYINVYENYTNEFEDEELIKSEEIEEFRGDLATLFESEGENWEQKLTAIFQKWAAKHPVWAKILVGFIIQIMIAITANCIQTGITKFMATIRNEPSTRSETVAIFDQNQTLSIIDDQTAYYYQVKFCEPETGEIKTGWVSKKSVMVIEEENGESETVPAETK